MIKIQSQMNIPKFWQFKFSKSNGVSFKGLNFYQNFETDTKDSKLRIYNTKNYNLQKYERKFTKNAPVHILNKRCPQY